MRISLRTVFVVVAIIVAALSFSEVSGRVVDWVKAMHGVGPAAHGSK